MEVCGFQINKFYVLWIIKTHPFFEYKSFVFLLYQDLVAKVSNLEVPF